MVINFCMDFLSLYVTARLLHLKPKKGRLTAAAVMGGVYSLVILSLDPTGSFSGAVSLAAAFLLTAAAYGKQKTKDLLKNTAVFYIVSFALGGGITAVCNLLNIWQNKRNIMINGTFDVVYGDLPFGLLVLLAALCGLFSLISGRYAAAKNARKECGVEITLDKKEVKLTGLVDSGNLLKDPISGKPVVITAFEAVRKIIPVELLSLFKTKDVDKWSYKDPSAGIRAIPVSTVNGSSLLFALRPDSVRIDGKEVDVYIAVSTDSDGFGGLPAVVPYEITR